MIKSKILFLFICTAFISFGQEFNTGTTQKDFYTEFSYEWINQKVIIPVEIEGHTYRFLLDTGAPNIISSSLSKKITTQLQQRMEISDANNKKDSMDIVTIPLMKIGGVSYSNIPSLINKEESNFIFECFNIDGFIGSNLLRNSIVQILPKEQIIKLTDDKSKLSLDRKNSSKIEFLDKQSTPYIWIKLKAIGEVNEQVFMDTGMHGFYALSNKNLKSFQENELFKSNTATMGVMGSGIFGSEDANTYYRLLVPKIEINKAVFTEVTVETTNADNSRIGAEILKHGKVTIDYIHKRFYFEPFEASVSLKKKSYGFNPTLIDDKLVIGLIWDNDLQNKMHFGDQILMVNGIDFTNYNTCDLVTQESIFKDAEELEMTIMDENVVKKTLTVKKTYFK